MKFKDLLKEFNIPSKNVGEHHHTTEGFIQIDCPFCSGKGSHKWHLGYSIEGRYFNCWRCGFHSPTKVIMELTGLSLSKSKKLLHKLEISEEETIVKPSGKLLLPKGIGQLLNMHKSYLRNRKLNWKEIQHLWKIQAIGIASRLQWRIFIPIHYKGEMVSWTTRSISDKLPAKYVTASPKEETIHHKSILYGQDYARHSIIVCEGPLDVWKIGFGAVATFGTNFTQAQVNQIAKYPLRAICFDTERTAQGMAKKLCDLLSPLPGETYNITLKSKDPAAANDKEVSKLRRKFLNNV